MKFHEINKEKLPKIYVSFHSENPTDEEVNRYLSDMTKIYQTHKNIVVIYNSDKVGYLKAMSRIKIGTWLKENAPTIKKSALGVAYVTKNVVATMALKGIFLIKKPEWQNRVCATLEEADKWADSLLIK